MDGSRRLSLWARLRALGPRVAEPLSRDEPFVAEELLMLFGAAEAAEERYWQGGEVPALEEAIEALETILRDPRIRYAPEFACAVMTNAGEAHFHHYRAVGDLGELDHALTLYRWGIASRPDGGAVLALLDNFAVALHERYERTGSVTHLDEAVETLRTALLRLPAGSDAPPRLLTNLSNSLTSRYQRLGTIADLEEAVAVSSQAVAATAPGAPELPGRLTNLGNALSYRYWHGGSVDDLDRAIEAFRDAVAETPPESHALPRRLNNLANGLSYRYRRAGSIIDSDEAIEAFGQALERTPPDSPERAGRLSNLARELRARAARTGELEQLEEGIRIAREAASQAGENSPDAAIFVSSLGDALLERYDWIGGLVDLETAVRHFRDAADRLPSDSAELRIPLAGLSNALQQRFRRTSDPADLSEALEVAREALDRTPADSPERAGRLLTLGTGLISRFSVTDDLSELDDAVNAYAEAVERTPDDSPHRAATLSTLGTTLALRSRRTNDPGGLEEAIRTLRQAVALAASGSPHRLGSLANLGLALREAESDEAIDVFQTAVAEAPGASAALPTLLAGLGFSLDERYARTGSAPDLDAAIAAYERAWAAVQAGRTAAPIAYQLGRQDQAALVARPLTEALLLRADLGSAPRDDRRRALEVAEAGKSRLLTDLLGRGELPAPVAVAPGDSARERALLEQLSALDRLELAFAGGSSPADGTAFPLDQDARLARLGERQRVGAELEALWEHLAALGPEAQNYVDVRRGEALGWAELAALATELGAGTALASLFIGERGTSLFILRAGWAEPRVVVLPLDSAAWAALTRRFFRELPSGRGSDRGQTWAESLRPLLANAWPLLEGVERIVFAPHGPSHALPWAVVALEAELRAPDGGPLPFVTLPALGLLPRLRRRARQMGSRSLVVGNPTGDLPHAESEAHVVAAALETIPLVGDRATNAAVRANIRGADLVHLATHAFFEPGAPLESGVVLSDGMLTAREVLEEQLRADLLVLSACESGLTGTLGGDEVAGLAQAFLQAGARSLLVSLWEVSDPATALLMEAFYAATSRGVDGAAALAAAQAGLRVRDNYAHPYYWAAFVFMGDWA